MQGELLEGSGEEFRIDLDGEPLAWIGLDARQPGDGEGVFRLALDGRAGNNLTLEFRGPRPASPADPDDPMLFDATTILNGGNPGFLMGVFDGRRAQLGTLAFLSDGLYVRVHPHPRLVQSETP